MEDLHLGKKVVLRNDGTSIYITQDLALAQLRYQDYAMDRMVYVVGNEQKDHFKSLFEIIKRMNFPFSEKMYHLSYGMISLPSGKMKSREGTVVDADTLADDMHLEAKDLLFQRYPELSQDELEKRAEVIAMSAIKFFILKYETEKDFVFDPAESLSFEGETGPYLQYSYARISSVLRKSDQ
jgi:arginyl-tRNA synthetase